jgi:hypothetical protein
MNGGNRHRRGLQFAMGGEQLIQRTETTTAELLRKRVGAGGVSINYSEQAYCFAGSLEFVVHAGVIAAERTCSYNSYVNDGTTSKVSNHRVRRDLPQKTQSKYTENRLKSQLRRSGFCAGKLLEHRNLAGVIKLVLRDPAEHVVVVVVSL